MISIHALVNGIYSFMLTAAAEKQQCEKEHLVFTPCVKERFLLVRGYDSSLEQE